ncbi:hypothetical protein [Carboxylicivirga sp. RSCT41]|uniref:hypothetical protein n=1 Tax=Carboxylicivirga agarovorans TaxID=3417570 RepID=UPI003D3577FE
MKNYLLPYILLIITCFVACDGSDDDEFVAKAALAKLEFVEKILQDEVFQLGGKIVGDAITSVVLYDGEQEVLNQQVAGSNFEIKIQLSSAGKRNLVLKALNNDDAVLADYSIPVTVIKRKATAFNSESTTNKLGLWIWYLEETGFKSHMEVVDKIYPLGVKRVFIKVGDGRNTWSEAANVEESNGEAFLSYYQRKGLEVYAWSYNYPGDAEEQALTLYEAAKSGYDGYVIDLEAEFDGKTVELEEVMMAFYEQMMEAVKDGFIDESFPLIVTTWGNPAYHNFAIHIVDKYVDAHMPQTYMEMWGGEWAENPENSIATGNQEYESLGAKKPVFHIISAEKTGDDAIGVDVLNRAIKASGPQTSIWKIPGSNMGGNWMDNWSILEKVEWNYDFSKSN